MRAAARRSSTSAIAGGGSQASSRSADRRAGRDYRGGVDRAPADRDPLPQRRVRTARSQATYHLDRVGLRTQEVHDLVIGDPRRPDLMARHAIIQMRLKWDGSFEVFRVFARGAQLRGRLVHGKVSWGQIDKLLPPPSGKPFQLPNLVLDVADSSISLATPFGPVGLALQGHGNLSRRVQGPPGGGQPAPGPGSLRRHEPAGECRRARHRSPPARRRPHCSRPLYLPGKQVRHRIPALRDRHQLQ